MRARAGRLIRSRLVLGRAVPVALAGCGWAAACGGDSVSGIETGRIRADASWASGDAAPGTSRPEGGARDVSLPPRADVSADASLLDASLDTRSGREADREVDVDGSTGATWFTDVTEAAGVSHVQASRFNCPRLDIGRCDSEAPRMTGGAAVGDVDGDGLLDLYVTRFDNRDLLLRNRGDGTFEEIGEAAGIGDLERTNGAGFADLDNDGDLDLYVTGLAHPQNFLFINDGSGHFSEEAVARGADVLPGVFRQGYSVSFGDYDRDGYLDLHTCDWRAWRNVVGTPPSASRLLRNLGSGSPGHFEDTTDAAGVRLEGISEEGIFSFASSFSDMDHDGWPDLVVAGDFGTSRLFWNDGDGTFTDGTEAAGVGTDENGMGSAIGDYDGDGRLDWFVTSIFDPDDTCAESQCTWGATGNRLFRNEGSRTFSDRTDEKGVREGYWGWGAAFFDYDNDGDLDLAMTNGVVFPGEEQENALERTPMRLWRNDGPGRMTEVSAELGLTDEGSGKGLLVFDYDDDGDLDLFVVNNNSVPRLYRNDRGNENDWLRVRVRGTRSNRDGLGARIRARPGGGLPEMVREIRGGSQFLGQSETVAHFGLGQGNAAVAELTVEWPSGVVQTLTDVGRNQTLVVTEPEGTPADGGEDGGDAEPETLDAAPGDASADG